MAMITVTAKTVEDAITQASVLFNQLILKSVGAAGRQQRQTSV